MSGQSGHGLDVVDASTGSTLRRLIHGYRCRNFLSSPLLRLPTELILKIFAHVIERDDNNDNHDNRHVASLLVLTAICYQLREAGTTSPQLWGAVDLTTPPIAELFLERCKYDPHTLKKTTSTSESLSLYPTENPRRDAVWEKLEGRTFNNLRSIIFVGTRHEFSLRIVGVLQRAPNVSDLDLSGFQYPFYEVRPWPISDLIPNLSTLRLRTFPISWTSPLLRNLTGLILDFPPRTFPSEHTSIEMFLTALANCPKLEILGLTYTGPDLPDGLHDNCDTVVQLHNLRWLSLQFFDPSTVGYILSHIGYPESTKLTVYVPASTNPDLTDIISQTLPQRSVRTIQHCRKSTRLSLHLLSMPFFSTDKLSFCFTGTGDRSQVYQVEPRVLVRFASKIVEVVGGETIISLEIVAREIDPPDRVWEELLHGLPRLERLWYGLTREEGDQDLVNPFVSVFSQPFEGGPVFPWLQHLKLPRVVLTQDASAMCLKRALTGG